MSAWHQLKSHSKENDFKLWREGERLKTRYFVEACGLSKVSVSQEEAVTATLKKFTFADIFVKGEWEIVPEIPERVENRWSILDFNKS